MGDCGLVTVTARAEGLGCAIEGLGWAIAVRAM
jgi:hypothetical protein